MDNILVWLLQWLQGPVPTWVLLLLVVLFVVDRVATAYLPIILEHRRESRREKNREVERSEAKLAYVERRLRISEQLRRLGEFNKNRPPPL